MEEKRGGREEEGVEGSRGRREEGVDGRMGYKGGWGIREEG